MTFPRPVLCTGRKKRPYVRVAQKSSCVSELAQEHHGPIELDVDPLICSGDRIVAVHPLLAKATNTS